MQYFKDDISKRLLKERKVKLSKNTVNYAVKLESRVDMPFYS